MNTDSHKAAISYMVSPAWGTIALAVTLAILNIGCIALTAMNLLPIWASFLFLTFTFHFSYTIVHEAVHGSIACKNPKLIWAQNLCGYLFSQFIALPFTAHRKEHLAHHQHTNIVGKDPDLFATEKISSLLTVSPRIYKSNIQFYIQNYWKNTSAIGRQIFLFELVVIFAWRIAVGLFASWEVMFFLTVLPLITGSTWLAFIFAWLVHKPFHDVGRYINTTTYTFPKKLDAVLSVLWGYQNYHSVHHLFPRVPFYRYRQVFNHIENDMIENHAPIVRIWQ